jgi:hypothetical protein
LAQAKKRTEVMIHERGIPTVSALHTRPCLFTSSTPYNARYLNPLGQRADIDLPPPAMASLAIPALDTVLATTFGVSVASQLVVFYGALYHSQLTTEKQRSWVLSTYTRSIDLVLLRPCT